MSLAQKLKDAGVDTIGARLTSACFEALKCSASDVEAWRMVGNTFGYEFMRSLMADMNFSRTTVLPQGDIIGPTDQGQWPVPRDFPVPTATYSPRVMPPERLERRRKLQEVIRSKYKNSAGVNWSDVGWHELYAMSRDGDEARTLLEAGPANVPNDGRSVEEVLGAKKINALIASVRKH